MEVYPVLLDLSALSGQAGFGNFRVAFLRGRGSGLQRAWSGSPEQPNYSETHCR